MRKQGIGKPIPLRVDNISDPRPCPKCGKSRWKTKVSGGLYQYRAYQCRTKKCGYVREYYRERNP